MPVTSYSTTPANNNSAPPNGAPEGWAPSAVNDTIRQIMADIRSFYDATALLAGTAPFTADQTISSGTPSLILTETDGGTDDKNWRFRVASEQLQFALLNDALGGAVSWLTVDRTDTTVDSIAFAATAVTINGNTVRHAGNSDATSSGTYSPTVTNVTNVSGSTAGTTTQYMRVGNFVTVSGSVTGSTSGAGTIVIGLSLPVASNFANSSQCCGAGGSASGVTGTSTVAAANISGDVTNDRALLTSVATGAGTFGFFYTYTYSVV